MKLAFHGPNAANFRANIESLLEARHEILDLSDALDRSGERSQFETADVIIGVKLGAAEPTPRGVRLYHAPAAGIDAIDRSRLPAGAALCNCFGHEDAIAEYVMTALLLRHVPIPRADERLRQGHWDFWAGQPGALRTELGSRTIGLLGFGHIGKAVAARAKAFGTRVLVCNRTPAPVGGAVDQSFGLDQLTTFMGRVDAVVVSLPLADATRSIVGRPELAAMRPDAVIINVGRGPVLEEQALYDALAEGRIGGAIIDTWYTYPSADAAVSQPSRLPFHTLQNVVMTPHMSGWTEGTIRRRQQTIAANINRLVRGEPLVNLLP
jgi:phosphoglycerate dehydrogenase-like enzyme